MYSYHRPSGQVHLYFRCMSSTDLAISIFRTSASTSSSSIYMVHASPPRSTLDRIKLLDVEGNFDLDLRQEWSRRLTGFGHDVLIEGHTHQLYAERLANTLVVNPGSTRFNHTCATLTFPALEFRWFSLSGKTPLRTWNWGLDL